MQRSLLTSRHTLIYDLMRSPHPWVPMRAAIASRLDLQGILITLGLQP
jgi:hypothetical protein